MPNRKLTYEQHCQFLEDANYMSYEQLMQKYNVCKSSIGYLKNRKPNKDAYMGDLELNHNFFNALTHESAYWLGFIAGDGAIAERDNCIKLHIQQQDEPHVDKFIKAVNTTNKKHYYAKQQVIGIKNGKPYKYYNNPSVEIRVYSKQMVNDLKKYGVGPRKSFTLKFPKLPKKYIVDYIRGLWDADGCITYSSRDKLPIVSFVGTYNSCKELAKYFNIKNKIQHDKSIRQISTSGFKQVQPIYDYLYKNATVYLDRKKQRFEELLKLND